MKTISRPVAAVVVAALLAAGCAATDSRGGAAPGAAAPEPSGPVVPTPESAPPSPTAAAPATPAPAPKNYEKVRIKVSGMTCPIRCVREVKEQLLAVPGVLHVEIDHDTRVATVDVVPGTAPESVAAGLHGDYRGRVM